MVLELLQVEEEVEGRAVAAFGDAAIADEQLLEDGLIEQGASLLGSAAVRGGAVGREADADVEHGLPFAERGVDLRRPVLQRARLTVDALLLAAECDDIDGAGVVRVELLAASFSTRCSWLTRDVRSVALRDLRVAISVCSSPRSRVTQDSGN